MLLAGRSVDIFSDGATQKMKAAKQKELHCANPGVKYWSTVVVMASHSSLSVVPQQRFIRLMCLLSRWAQSTRAITWQNEPIVI